MSDKFRALMESVDADLLEEAMMPVKKKKPLPWVGAAIAACLLLVIGLTQFSGRGSPVTVEQLSEMGYEIKIASYSQQMDELQERQRELKATVGRFAEVKYWMDTFKEHVHSGEKMDTTDAVVLRQLTDRIVVHDDRLEIHLRIGVALEQLYT